MSDNKEKTMNPFSDNEQKNHWVPLIDYRRNEIPECTIYGSISWMHGNKQIYSYGGNVVCYGRSMMKPIMMKVFQKELDPVLNIKQKAISLASHNGDTEHVEAVKSILSKDEINLMQVPHSLPLIQFGKQHRRPRRYYHCCSGEHAAILKGCKLKSWNRVGYTWPHHEFFQAYKKKIKEILGEDWEPAKIAKDGCGLPTMSMTVNELAKIFSYLAQSKEEDWIWDAMIKEPDLVGGFNRLDSTILKSCHGKVLAKEGADGLLGLSIIHPNYPEGLGIVLKIAHGWDSRAAWYIARWTLGVLGFTFRNPYPLDRQKAFIVEETIPPFLRDKAKAIEPWDDWDPNRDRWLFDEKQYVRNEEVNYEKIKELH